jgi:hypothetical protein
VLTSGGGYGIILERQGTAKQTAPKRSARIEASCEAKTEGRLFWIHLLNEKPNKENGLKKLQKTA